MVYLNIYKCSDDSEPDVSPRQKKIFRELHDSFLQDISPGIGTAIQL